MAVLSKANLQSAVTADPNFTAGQKTIINNIIDSYEDVFQDLTTVQRDAIATPAAGDVIYNTDNDRYEFYNGSAWTFIGDVVGQPQTRKTSLSSADITALNGTPIELVPAPGVGYAILPIAIAYFFDYGTVQYNFGAGALRIFTDSLARTNYVAEIDTTIINDNANIFANIPCDGYEKTSIVENKKLKIDAASTPTTGDGVMNIWVTYAIILT